jgi:uncharacterized protein (TIGR02145 family)
MKKIIKIIFTISMSTIILSLTSNKSISQVTDIDGNTYKTVTIGTQVWMAENLKVEHYCNGDIIPQVKDSTEWANLETGAWCYYENKKSNGTKYGKIYNWYAVNDSRGLAPEGWHIPANAEWQTLFDFLGGDDVAGEKMKSTSNWEHNGNGTNESGFTGLPGGGRNVFGSFSSAGYFGDLWSSTEIKAHYASNYCLGYIFSSVLYNYIYKGNGCSVRCVRD